MNREGTAQKKGTVKDKSVLSTCRPTKQILLLKKSITDLIINEKGPTKPPTKAITHFWPKIDHAPLEKKAQEK